MLKEEITNYISVDKEEAEEVVKFSRCVYVLLSPGGPLLIQI